MVVGAWFIHARIDGLVKYPSDENLDLLAQMVTRLLADGLLLPEHQHLSMSTSS